MVQQPRHPTLMHLWDFANRANYILGELENVEAGRPLQYPEQIPDYKYKTGECGVLLISLCFILAGLP